MVISPHTQGSTPLSFPAVANQHQFHTTPSIPAPISAAVLYSLKQHHNSRQQHLQTTLLTAGLLHNKHSTRTTFFFPTIFLLQLQFLCFKHLISTNSSNTNTKSAQTSSLSSSKLQIKHTAPLTHTCRAPHKTCSSSHSDAFIQSQQAANSSTQPSPCLSLHQASTTRTTTQLELLSGGSAILLLVWLLTRQHAPSVLATTSQAPGTRTDAPRPGVQLRRLCPTPHHQVNTAALPLIDSCDCHHRRLSLLGSDTM